MFQNSPGGSRFPEKADNCLADITQVIPDEAIRTERYLDELKNCEIETPSWENAVEGLSGTKDPEALCVLCDLLKKEKDSDAGMIVAEALQGTISYTALSCLCCELTSNWDAGARTIAAYALAGTRNHRARFLLLRASEEDVDSYVRSMAKYALDFQPLPEGALPRRNSERCD